MKANRNISDHDRQNAERLNTIWGAKRHALGLTQEAAAFSLGCTQSIVSSSLNGKYRINTDAVLGWARLLHVQPGDIDPNLSHIELVPEDDCPLAVTHTLSGEAVPSGARICDDSTINSTSRVPYGVLVDCHQYDPYAPVGSILIVEPGCDPVPGDSVFLSLVDDSQFYFRNLVRLEPDCLIVSSRDRAAVETVEMIPLNVISVLDTVVSIVRPARKRELKANPPTDEELYQRLNETKA